MAFSHDRASRLAAAMTYYAVFALAPLLFLMVVVGGFFLQTQDVQRALRETISSLLGAQEAELVTSLLNRTDPTKGGALASALGGITLVLGATNLLVQLQGALNTLWGADPPPNPGVLGQIRTRVVAFFLVLLFGLLVIAVLVGNTVLVRYGQELGNMLGIGDLSARLVTLGVTVLVFTVVFAVIYKVLPSVSLSWRDVWSGALITAILFTAGQTLLSLYFAHVSPGSLFGAAGSLVVVLLWMYYSAQMLFFGAEMTWVISQRYGLRGGGAYSVMKKAALVRLGASLDPAPSAVEQEAAEQTPGAIPPEVNEELAARAADAGQGNEGR